MLDPNKPQSSANCVDTLTTVVAGNLEWKECELCGDDVHIERWTLGYRYCKFCGEEIARTERASWCVVQEYGKGNYQFVTPTSALTTLKNTNQKQLRG
jgi:hypothetical protein